MPEGGGGYQHLLVYITKKNQCATQCTGYTHILGYILLLLCYVAPCRQHSLVAMGIAVYGNIILY